MVMETINKSPISWG